jgi:hypothetical protein
VLYTQCINNKKSIILMMMFALQTFIILAALAAYYSMPYHAPLQGLVGGKRTLVLLDDLVRIYFIFSSV